MGPEDTTPTNASAHGRGLSTTQHEEHVYSNLTSTMGSSNSGQYLPSKGSSSVDYRCLRDGNQNSSYLHPHQQRATRNCEVSQQKSPYWDLGFHASMGVSSQSSIDHGCPAPGLGVNSSSNPFSVGDYPPTALPQIGDQSPDSSYANDVYNNGPSQSHDPRGMRLSPFAGNCSYCHVPVYPSIEAPLVLCPGCGPMCNIRYCSVACLLVDVLNHSICCMQCPASQRLIHHNLLADFIYEQNPIAPLDGLPDPPCRLRQKTFSMYCYSGQFPKLYKAWAKKLKDLPSIPGFDENESIKKTGDYAVFRSKITAGVLHDNPNADVIFT
jgi:hypothetical protein